MDKPDELYLESLIARAKSLMGHQSYEFANPDLKAILPSVLQQLQEFKSQVAAAEELPEHTTRELAYLDEQLDARRAELDSVASPSELAEMRRLVLEILANIERARAHPLWERFIAFDPEVESASKQQEQAALTALGTLDAHAGETGPQPVLSSAILSFRTGLESLQAVIRSLDGWLPPSDSPDSTLAN